MKTPYFLAFLTAILFSIAPVSALAADVQTGNIISVPATQAVTANEYLAGGEVVFLANAPKDVTAAGGQVLVNGPVAGDVLLAGGTLQVLQPVKGDVRAIGGQITIGNDVDGDVLAAGGTIIVLPGTTVKGDVIVAGGVVDIEGTVNGSVHVYGGNVIVDGTIAGPADIHASKQVTFGEKAVIGSTLAYSASQEATVAPGAKLGSQVTFSKDDGFSDKEGRRDVAGIVWGVFGFLVLAKFFGILVIGLIFVIAFKGFAQEMAERTMTYFWKKVLIGLAALVAIPIAAIICFITMIGLYLGLALVLSYLLILLAAGVYMCVLAGALLSRWIRKTAIADWKWTLLGTVAVFILGLVPVVGWIADCLLMLAALGSVVMSVKHAVHEQAD